MCYSYSSTAVFLFAFFGVDLDNAALVGFDDLYRHALGVKCIARLGYLFKLLHHPAADGRGVASRVDVEKLIDALALGKAGK